ncbi:hypothetical protein F8M41_002450 [Gigaspora margarita]|uniref:Uncharacterized protein n=1 Tax=Gigaspora margarita TaxID=4874 RepID=A0A8H3XE96_GIGMA|nr:hypothetical protein F8M41_002450 [Gigaspora margarita]
MSQQNRQTNQANRINPTNQANQINQINPSNILYTSDERYDHLSNGINPFSREQARQEEVSQFSITLFSGSSFN